MNFCIVTINVLWLFLVVPWVGLQCVIVVLSDHTHLIFAYVTCMNIKSNRCWLVEQSLYSVIYRETNDTSTITNDTYEPQLKQLTPFLNFKCLSSKNGRLSVRPSVNKLQDILCCFIEMCILSRQCVSHNNDCSPFLSF